MFLSSARTAGDPSSASSATFVRAADRVSKTLGTSRAVRAGSRRVKES